jgi:hypothetical protein
MPRPRVVCLWIPNGMVMRVFARLSLASVAVARTNSYLTITSSVLMRYVNSLRYFDSSTPDNSASLHRSDRNRRVLNMELSRFHHSRSRDTQLRTRGGINLARNGVDVTWSDAKHYRTCNLSTPKVHEEPV